MQTKNRGWLKRRIFGCFDLFPLETSLTLARASMKRRLTAFGDNGHQRLREEQLPLSFLFGPFATWMGR